MAPVDSMGKGAWARARVVEVEAAGWEVMGVEVNAQ